MAHLLQRTVLEQIKSNVTQLQCSVGNTATSLQCVCFCSSSVCRLLIIQCNVTEDQTEVYVWKYFKHVAFLTGVSPLMADVSAIWQKIYFHVHILRVQSAAAFHCAWLHQPLITWIQWKPISDLWEISLLILNISLWHCCAYSSIY